MGYMAYRVELAAYARVSTTDKGQNPDVQLAEINHYALQRGWQITRQYVDVVSGAKERRPQLDKLVYDVQRGLVSIIIVVRLDRLSRRLKHLVNLLAELGERNVALISIKEGLDFSTSTGRLLFHVIGALAEFERDLIRERVKAGLAFAKSRGVKIGRPVKIDPATMTKIRDMKAQGASLRMIAQALNISRSAAHNIIATRKSCVTS
jgi:DNA invertase Pin-like site-specific DNA recombinase